jgi:hypothetical protein
MAAVERTADIKTFRCLARVVSSREHIKNTSGRVTDSAPDEISELAPPCRIIGEGVNCLTGKSVSLVIFCLAPFAKIFRSAFDPNHIYINSCPAPHRGVSRSSRTRGGMQWTRQRQVRRCERRADFSVSDHRAHRREMLTRTAKSCGPDAPALASSWRRFLRARPGVQSHIRKRR